MAWAWGTEFGDPSRKPGVPRRADGGGGNPLHERVMQLQATAGNAAVQRLIQQDGAEQAQSGIGAGGGSSDAQAQDKAEILRYGSRGEAVKRLQERLNQSGSAGAELKVDGIMGPLTTAALRRFQKAHPPLDVDGTAGPEVWAELERVGDQGAPMAGVSARDFHEKGKKLYGQGRYALAFDEFSKAHELDSDPVYVFNMAQALRLLGGRADEAMKLYEQFLSMGPGEEGADTARRKMAELRGPAPSGDAKKDKAAADALYDEGKKLYLDAEWGPAYDAFTKAWNLTHDPALLWNRAVSMRSMGGQRSQAIALYEQVLTVDVPEENKVAAREEIAELKGPGRSGDPKKDEEAETKVFDEAQARFQAEDFAKAYDGFTKAWEINHSAEMIWNRAQALRLLGGRREEAIRLYQQVLGLDVSEDIKKSARVHIAELKGPGKAGTGAGRPN